MGCIYPCSSGNRYLVATRQACGSPCRDFTAMVVQPFLDWVAGVNCCPFSFHPSHRSPNTPKSSKHPSHRTPYPPPHRVSNTPFSFITPLQFASNTPFFVINTLPVGKGVSFKHPFFVINTPLETPLPTGTSRFKHPF